jgi:hypothetical protein
MSCRRCWQYVAVVLLLLVTGACGNGSSQGSSSGGSPGNGSSGGGTLSNQQRVAAAQTTADSNAQCTSLTPFYWEIGDKDGALASGTGGDNSTTPPNSATVMGIASASKWIFAAYVLEKLDVSSANPLTSDEISLLNFTSGYHNLYDATCWLSTTVGGCFNAANPLGGNNSDQITGDIGKFYYNGGHMQALATNALNLGGDYDNVTTATPKLATEIQTYIGQDITLLYTNPSLAGGIAMSPGMYAAFLRKILSGDLRVKNYLGVDAVCAHANSTDCPGAIYSPVNQTTPGAPNDIGDEAWHYSLGHWVEDDPKVGDGSFSSPGADGFYPWIDASKTYYGILARYVPIATAASAPADQKPYITSVYCGRLIRKAWLTGTAQ